MNNIKKFSDNLWINVLALTGIWVEVDGTIGITVSKTGLSNMTHTVKMNDENTAIEHVNSFMEGINYTSVKRFTDKHWIDVSMLHSIEIGLDGKVDILCGTYARNARFDDVETARDHVDKFIESMEDKDKLNPN